MSTTKQQPSGGAPLAQQSAERVEPDAFVPREAIRTLSGGANHVPATLTLNDDGGKAVAVFLSPQPAQQQEPVAWIEHEWSGSGLKHLHFDRREPSVRDEVMNPVWTPLYTSPPTLSLAQRTWVGLTDEEAQKTFMEHNCTISADLAGILARAIEAKLKAKNSL